MNWLRCTTSRASAHGGLWSRALWSLLFDIGNYEHRWFILTGAALLQVALHGLAGVSYLLAGLIAVALAAIAIAISYMTRSRTDPSDAT